jgi:hypothetical protein
MLKPHTIVDTTPEVVRDEMLLPRDGSTIYWLALPDEYVELLARGVVPEEVSRRCYANLEWKRMNARALSRSLERKKRA